MSMALTIGRADTMSVATSKLEAPDVLPEQDPTPADVAVQERRQKELKLRPLPHLLLQPALQPCVKVQALPHLQLQQNLQLLHHQLQEHQQQLENQQQQLERPPDEQHEERHQQADQWRPHEKHEDRHQQTELRPQDERHEERHQQTVIQTPDEQYNRRRQQTKLQPPDERYKGRRPQSEQQHDERRRLEQRQQQRLRHWQQWQQKKKQQESLEQQQEPQRYEQKEHRPPHQQQCRETTAAQAHPQQPFVDTERGEQSHEHLRQQPPEHHDQQLLPHQQETQQREQHEHTQHQQQLQETATTTQQELRQPFDETEMREQWYKQWQHPQPKQLEPRWLLPKEESKRYRQLQEQLRETTTAQQQLRQPFDYNEACEQLGEQQQQQPRQQPLQEKEPQRYQQQKHKQQCPQQFQKTSTLTRQQLRQPFDDTETCEEWHDQTQHNRQQLVQPQETVGHQQQENKQQYQEQLREAATTTHQLFDVIQWYERPQQPLRPQQGERQGQLQQEEPEVHKKREHNLEHQEQLQDTETVTQHHRRQLFGHTQMHEQRYEQAQSQSQQQPQPQQNEQHQPAQQPELQRHNQHERQEQLQETATLTLQKLRQPFDDAEIHEQRYEQSQHKREQPLKQQETEGLQHQGDKQEHPKQLREAATTTQQSLDGTEMCEQWHRRSQHERQQPPAQERQAWRLEPRPQQQEREHPLRAWSKQNLLREQQPLQCRTHAQRHLPSRRRGRQRKEIQLQEQHQDEKSSDEKESSGHKEFSDRQESSRNKESSDELESSDGQESATNEGSSDGQESSDEQIPSDKQESSESEESGMESVVRKRVSSRRGKKRNSAQHNERQKLLLQVEGEEWRIKRKLRLQKLLQRAKEKTHGSQKQDERRNAKKRFKEKECEREHENERRQHTKRAEGEQKSKPNKERVARLKRVRDEEQVCEQNDERVVRLKRRLEEERRSEQQKERLERLKRLEGEGRKYEQNEKRVEGLKRVVEEERGSEQNKERVERRKRLEGKRQKSGHKDGKVEHRKRQKRKAQKNVQNDEKVKNQNRLTDETLKTGRNDKKVEHRRRLEDEESRSREWERVTNFLQELVGEGCRSPQKHEFRKPRYEVEKEKRKSRKKYEKRKHLKRRTEGGCGYEHDEQHIRIRRLDDRKQENLQKDERRKLWQQGDKEECGSQRREKRRKPKTRVKERERRMEHEAKRGKSKKRVKSKKQVKQEGRSLTDRDDLRKHFQHLKEEGRSSHEKQNDATMCQHTTEKPFLPSLSSTSVSLLISNLPLSGILPAQHLSASKQSNVPNNTMNAPEVLLTNICTTGPALRQFSLEREDTQELSQNRTTDSQIRDTPNERPRSTDGYTSAKKRTVNGEYWFVDRAPRKSILLRHQQFGRRGVSSSSGDDDESECGEKMLVVASQTEKTKTEHRAASTFRQSITIHSQDDDESECGEKSSVAVSRAEKRAKHRATSTCRQSIAINSQNDDESENSEVLSVASNWTEKMKTKHQGCATRRQNKDRTPPICSQKGDERERSEKSSASASRVKKKTKYQETSTCQSKDRTSPLCAQMDVKSERFEKPSAAASQAETAAQQAAPARRQSMHGPPSIHRTKVTDSGSTVKPCVAASWAKMKKIPAYVAAQQKSVGIPPMRIRAAPQHENLLLTPAVTVTDMTQKVAPQQTKKRALTSLSNDKLENHAATPTGIDTGTTQNVASQPQTKKRVLTSLSNDTLKNSATTPAVPDNDTMQNDVAPQPQTKKRVLTSLSNDTLKNPATTLAVTATDTMQKVVPQQELIKRTPVASSNSEDENVWCLDPCLVPKPAFTAVRKSRVGCAEVKTAQTAPPQRSCRYVVSAVLGSSKVKRPPPSLPPNVHKGGCLKDSPASDANTLKGVSTTVSHAKKTAQPPRKNVENEGGDEIKVTNAVVSELLKLPARRSLTKRPPPPLPASLWTSRSVSVIRPPPSPPSQQANLQTSHPVSVIRPPPSLPESLQKRPSPQARARQETACPSSPSSADPRSENLSCSPPFTDCIPPKCAAGRLFAAQSKSRPMCLSSMPARGAENDTNEFPSSSNSCADDPCYDIRAPLPLQIKDRPVSPSRVWQPESENDCCSSSADHAADKELHASESKSSSGSVNHVADKQRHVREAESSGSCADHDAGEERHASEGENAGRGADHVADKERHATKDESSGRVDYAAENRENVREEALSGRSAGHVANRWPRVNEDELLHSDDVVRATNSGADMRKDAWSGGVSDFAEHTEDHANASGKSNTDAGSAEHNGACVTECRQAREARHRPVYIKQRISHGARPRGSVNPAPHWEQSQRVSPLTNSADTVSDTSLKEHGVQQKTVTGAGAISSLLKYEHRNMPIPSSHTSVARPAARYGPMSTARATFLSAPRSAPKVLPEKPSSTSVSAPTITLRPAPFLGFSAPIRPWQSTPVSTPTETPRIRLKGRGKGKQKRSTAALEAQSQLANDLSKGAQQYDPSRNKHAWDNAERFGRTGKISVRDICVSHDRVSKEFTHGPHKDITLAATLEALQKGTESTLNFTPVVLMRQDGLYWVIFGNRRVTVSKWFQQWVGDTETVHIHAIVYDTKDMKNVPSELIAKYISAKTNSDPNHVPMFWTDTDTHNHHVQT